MHDIPARLGQMRLRDLRLLDFVARLKTLGKIAEQLHLTQPAVTQALQALEQSFGTQLVVRESRGVTLTPAGTAALAHLRAMAAEAELAWAAAHRPVRPVIRLGCSPMASLMVVPHALARLRQSSPQTHVLLEEANVHALWQMLSDGLVDALVARRPDLSVGERSPEGVAVEVVGRERMVLIGPAHPKKRAIPTLAEISAGDWVLPPPDSMVARAFARFFATHHMALPTVVFTSTSFLTNMRVAAACGLFTIAPESVAREQGPALSLQVVDLPWEGGLSEIVLAYRQSRADDEVLQQLRNCLAPD